MYLKKKTRSIHSTRSIRSTRRFCSPGNGNSIDTQVVETSHPAGTDSNVDELNQVVEK